METSAQVPAPRTPKTRAMGRKKLPVLVDIQIQRHHRIATARFRKVKTGAKIAAVWGTMIAAGLAVPFSLAPWSIAAVFFGLVFYSGMSTNRFNRENARGLELLKAREVEGALEAFEALTRRSGRQKVVAVYNSAIALLSAGEVEAALAHFAETQVSRIVQIHAPACAHIALCFGLLGDAHAAKAWLDEFDARTKSPNRAHLRFLKSLAETVWHLRLGHAQAAMEVMDAHGRNIAGQFAGVLPGIAETVWSYTLENAGRREDKRFRALVAELEADANHDQLRAVFESWPDVRAFIDGLDLGWT